MKRNPAYKGKWHPSSIDNPNYKGIWKPQQIPNPDYFELDRPDFEPVAAIGIEIWTMQDGILFDNILIASDEKVAESYREKTWKPKFEVEKAKEKAEDSASASDSLAGFKVLFYYLYIYLFYFILLLLFALFGRFHSNSMCHTCRRRYLMSFTGLRTFLSWRLIKSRSL